METQKIRRTDLKYFYDKVCDGWKTAIFNHLADQIGEEITVDNALLLKAYNEADASIKKELKKRFTIIDSSKWYEKFQTIDDIYKHFDLKREDVIPFKNISEAAKDNIATKFQEATNAMTDSFYIAEALNKGKKPDWNNGAQPKYQLYFRLDGGGFSYSDYGHWYAHTDVGSLLVFLDKEAGIYAANQFGEDIYRKWVKP
jgi:hypothetical protein